MSTPDRVTKLISGIIAVEGGYVNDPADLGGETKYGITVAVARAYGYQGPMRDMPESTAFDIYLSKYYRGPKFDQVAKRAPMLAEELTDTGVNMGQQWPAKFLQRSLNAFNDQGRLYADIATDGRIGPATLRALDAYLGYRGDEGADVLTAACDHLQAARYLELAEAREANERFVYGWILNRTEVHRP